MPDQTGETNFVDSDLHSLSCGLGILLREVTEILPKPFAIDLHFQYQRLEDRKTVKAKATDPIGDYEASGEFFNFGMTLLLHF